MKKVVNLIVIGTITCVALVVLNIAHAQVGTPGSAVWIGEVENRMKNVITSFEKELVEVQIPRAHPDLLKTVTVQYQGVATPLHQVAAVTVENSTTLAVMPQAASIVREIERAIQNANLGLVPSISGTMVRVHVPAITEERRAELLKDAKARADKGREAVQNIALDANGALNSHLQNQEISVEEEQRCREKVRKVADTFGLKINQLLAKKEADLKTP